MATTYYVSPYGSDANNGLGPDPGAATNKPWLTVQKALQVGGIASGDTVQICPGIYRAAFAVNITSPTVETFVIGDVGNLSGFKDGSGNRVAGGEVRLTAFLTSDKVAGGGSSPLNLNGCDHLTFQRLVFQAGSVYALDANTAISTNIKLQECTFLPGTSSNQSIVMAGQANTPFNWTIDRCLFVASSNTAIEPIVPSSGTADYDIGLTIQNCLFLGNGIFPVTTGALAFKPGGITVYNCSFLFGGIGGCLVITTPSVWSTSLPMFVYNSFFLALGGTALSAGGAGQIHEDWNIIQASTAANASVTRGGHSVDNTYAPVIHAGQELLWGGLLRLIGTPGAGSPLLGFGAQAGGPAVDLLNRPRPAGGGSTSYAAGALERHDNATKETVTVDNVYAAKLTGPADQEVRIAVNAQATTIAIKVRYDTNHGTTNKPQVLLLATDEIGVAAQTLTASVGIDTWETLTFAPITPIQRGWVTLRLVSRAAAGTGCAFFDTVNLT